MKNLTGSKIGLYAAGGLLGILMTTTSAFATNGYIPHGFGAAQKGMAGAGGTTLNQDGQVAMSNPAGVAHTGDRVDVGLEVFSPRRSAELTSTGGFIASTGAGKQKSDSNWFYIPSAAVTKDMGDYSVGINITAAGGMNTDYKNVIFAGGSGTNTGIDLAQLFVGATYARKLDGNHSFGVTPTFAAQRFAASGLQGFQGISSSSDKVTSNGYDYSYGGGIRVGWQGQLTDTIRAGASYQSRMFMSKFDKYKGLFANEGEFDIPPIMNIGVSYQAKDDLVLAADIQHIRYGDIDSIANTHNVNAQAGKTLGGPGGIGFGWDHMTVFKVGAEWTQSPELTLRGGYSYTDQPFPDVETLFNILAPATIRHHVSAGGTYSIGDNHELSAAFTVGLSGGGIGGKNFNHAGQIGLDMTQYDLEVGYAYKF